MHLSNRPLPPSRPWRFAPIPQAPLLWSVALSILWIALLKLFYLHPQIDLAVAGWFFDRVTCSSASGKVCGLFFLADQPLLGVLRKILFYLPHLAAVILIGVWVVKAHHPHPSARERQMIGTIKLALLSLLLGPGLLVNGALKEWSGRPRPYQTDLFGGHDAFVAAGDFSGSCGHNCSFISGEAAGAGWLICLVPLLPVRWRRWVGPPLIALALLTPLLRVAFGGHYLSDAVLGFLSSPLVFALVFALHRLFSQLRYF
ncbi:phosphatase PAP2 family protein [Allorhizobium sp. BGMRC 0089]|uniref:phosphatase PAP2 family protein n=1 Tax=Allorhizobium sonneratiae TaxID=2934936 RepID=UPI0020345208|nr:phosphatase PAP2 family protein [Allorhizobium sonneratiae]MCM2292064.1 phosphatase PAP2 family protein [Allorhizobium sonneratiae]